MPEETKKFHNEEIKELYGLDKVQTPRGRKIKNTGGASDVFEAANEGRVHSKTIHKVYKKDDSVDDMAKSTLDLISDTSRQVVKEIQRTQNDMLADIVGRSYTPRRPKNKNNELDAVLGSISRF